MRHELFIAQEYHSEEEKKGKNEIFFRSWDMNIVGVSSITNATTQRLDKQIHQTHYTTWFLPDDRRYCGIVQPLIGI